MEADERNKARKKRRRLASIDTGTTAPDVTKEDVTTIVEQEDDEMEEVKPPAALNIIKDVQNEMKKFKVKLLLLKNDLF